MTELSIEKDKIHSQEEKTTFGEKVLNILRRVSANPWVFYPLFSVMILYIAASNLFSVGINGTPSLPEKVFVFQKHFDKDSLSVGDVVRFEYRYHEFFPFGSKFVKIIAGVEGDVVEHIGQDIVINGKHIGAAKLFAGPNQEFDPLDISEPGVIPKDHFFLYTPYEHSFDSRYRYIGFAHKDRIIGKGIFSFGRLADGS